MNFLGLTSSVFKKKKVADICTSWITLRSFTFKVENERRMLAIPSCISRCAGGANNAI